MKKVGIYMDFEPSGGGSYQYAVALLSALAKLAGTDGVVAFHTSPDWQRHLDRYGVRGVLVRKSFFWRALWRFWRKAGWSVPLWRSLCGGWNPWAKSIARERCALCFFPTQNLDAVQLEVPSVVSVHDLMHRYERRFPEVGNPVEFKDREFLYSSLCQFTTAILVDSELGKRQLIESYGVDPRKVWVFPFTVPVYLRERPLVPKDQLPFRLPEKYLFYPAQFWLHKNHLGLLGALKLCIESGDRVHLVLCGSGKNASATVKDFVMENQLADHVTFLKYVPDELMASLYHYSEGLVYPSFFGPTNIPPLEARYMGKPMALSDVYAMKEQSGDAAIYFDPGNIPQIADAMRTLWRSGGKGPDCGTSESDDERTLRNLDSLLKKFLG